jgi:hypothetical protein
LDHTAGSERNIVSSTAAQNPVVTANTILSLRFAEKAGKSSDIWSKC